MHQLEVFFDYACPYCLKGHEYLAALLPGYPQIEVVWCPCEAHPRPDRYGPHSDLCIQGMFFAAEHGVDIWAYHNRMYQAALKERIDVENIDALAEYMSDLLDAGKYRAALTTGVYAKRLQNANDYAYQQNGVWAVPSYRMDGRKLDSIENIGVSQKQLAEFMDHAKG